MACTEQELKAKACSAIDNLSQELFDLSTDLWKTPELKFEEYKSHDTLTAFFEKHGFDVERKYTLDTAFCASSKPEKQGDEPCVAVFCEYDALPQIGHACGHNLIAEAGAAAAIGIKAALDHAPTGFGHLVAVGTPAEEGGGGKILMLESGCFENIDFSMMVHPAPFDIIYPVALATQEVFVTYTGHAAHAAAFPWEGINALDAAVQCYNNISMLRQQIKPTWRVHGVFTDGGVKPNIIPERSQLNFYLRAPSVAELETFKKKANNCFNGAAKATGCSVDIKWRGFGKDNLPYLNIKTNPILGSLYQKHAESFGIEFPPDNVQNQLPVGATDMGNISQFIPSIHPIYSITSKAANHTHEFTASSGAADAQKPTLIAAKAMALTTIEVLYNQQTLNNVKKTFFEE